MNYDQFIDAKRILSCPSGFDAEEEARIRELIALNTWPNKWIGTEVTGDQLIDQVRVIGNELVTQPVLVR